MAGQRESIWHGVRPVLEQFVGEMIRLYLDVMDIQILSTTIHRDGSVSLYFRGPRDQIIRLAHIFRGRTYTPQGWTGPNELYAEVTV